MRSDQPLFDPGRTLTAGRTAGVARRATGRLWTAESDRTARKIPRPANYFAGRPARWTWIRSCPRQSVPSFSRQMTGTRQYRDVCRKPRMSVNDVGTADRADVGNAKVECMPGNRPRPRPAFILIVHEDCT